MELGRMDCLRSYRLRARRVAPRRCAATEATPTQAVRPSACGDLPPAPPPRPTGVPQMILTLGTQTVV